MNLTETASYLRWLSQADGRIQTTDPNLQIWQDALSNATPNEVREATLEFTRTNDGTMVTPAAIRRMAYAHRERAAARKTALTAAPKVKHPNMFRARNPELWDHLFQQGQQQRLDNLRRKGILT